jgi:hypothetical protein
MNKILVSSIGVVALVTFASMAHGAVIVYSAVLDGPSEFPTNTSPGIGTATVTVDDTLDTMRVVVSFSGLLGDTTASHIHAATTVPFAGATGVATQTPSFSGFPLGVKSGSMDTTFDMTLTSSYNPAYVSAHGGTAATSFADLETAMNDGKAYLNIHTTSFPGGEIRGFLIATPVPEPASAALIVLGCATMMARRRPR